MLHNLRKNYQLEKPMSVQRYEGFTENCCAIEISITKCKKRAMMKRAVHLHKLPKDFQMGSLNENITQRNRGVFRYPYHPNSRVSNY